jgi:hypothetical protein
MKFESLVYYVFWFQVWYMLYAPFGTFSYSFLVTNREKKVKWFIGLSKLRFLVS